MSNLFTRKTDWRIIPLCICLWSLAGHFLRGQFYLLAIAATLLPLLFFWTHRAGHIILQIILVISVFAVWTPATYEIALNRIIMGQPWLRMIFIMGSVITLNLITMVWLFPFPQNRQSSN